MKNIYLIFIVFFLACVNLYSQDNDFVKLIVSKDDINLSNANVAVVPSIGVCALFGNKVFPLSNDKTILSMTFPDYIYIDDMFWSGYDFIVKSMSDVYFMSDCSAPIMTFDTDEYSIFPWDSTRIFITIHHGDSSSLFLGSLLFGKAKRLLTINEHIIYVSASGDDTFVVTTESIYLFNKEKCERYFNFWSPVHTAVMTRLGLMFATDEEICLLKDIDTFATLFEGSCLKLLYDYKYLYILTSDYDLYSIDLSQL